MAEADPRKPDFVNVHEAKTHFSRLLDRAHGGEEIVIAKAGTPYAKLVPIAGIMRKPRALGGLGYELPETFLDPMTDDDLAQWGLK